MAEDYRVGDGHVTDLRCVIVNMKYFCFESKKNLLKLLNRLRKIFQSCLWYMY